MTIARSCRLKYWSHVLLLTLLSSLNSLAQGNVNVVYVESNIGQTTNQNSVFAFANDGTGKLKAVKGSPYLTQGTGVFNSNPAFAPGFQADQEIVANKAGTLLFAVNGNSNTISSFAINTDGSLALIGNPVISHGPDPVSLGLDETPPLGTVLSVVNQDADPGQTTTAPNAITFFVSPGGVLTPVGQSTLTYPPSSLPSQALVSPSGNFTFLVQYQGGGGLYSYDVGAGGRLVFNNTVTPTKGSVFLGAAAHAKQRAIYVGLPDVNSIAAYTYSKAGVTAFSHLVSNPGLQVGWMATDPKGTRLYTSEENSNSVTVYDISGSNFTKPVQLQHLLLAPGGLATNVKLDPTGAFLYVLGLDNPPAGVGNFVHVLNVSSVDGTLTETLPPTAVSVPSGEIPMGLAVALR